MVCDYRAKLKNLILMSLYNIRYGSVLVLVYNVITPHAPCIKYDAVLCSINSKGLQYLTSKQELMPTLVWILQGTVLSFVILFHT